MSQGAMQNSQVSVLLHFQFLSLHLGGAHFILQESAPYLHGYISVPWPARALRLLCYAWLCRFQSSVAVVFALRPLEAAPSPGEKACTIIVVCRS